MCSVWGKRRPRANARRAHNPTWSTPEAEKTGCAAHRSHRAPQRARARRTCPAVSTGPPKIDRQSQAGRHQRLFFWPSGGAACQGHQQPVCELWDCLVVAKYRGDVGAKRRRSAAIQGQANGRSRNGPARRGQQQLQSVMCGVWILSQGRKETCFAMNRPGWLGAASGGALRIQKRRQTRSNNNQAAAAVDRGFVRP